MDDSSAIIIMNGFVGLIIWLYAFIRTIKSEFHKPSQKKVWIIALIFLPPTALLFPFIGDKQTK